MSIKLPARMRPNSFSMSDRTFIRCGISLAVVLAFAFTLAACSSKRSAFEGTGSPIYSGSGPVPKGGGVYKVGNPYQVAGRWYYPKEEPSYDKTGTASWYGPKFNRRQTSNGEWFDMNRITAAHPTLPLPSYARVTNLQNNKTIVVRINDRGPYAHDRIIDLSKRSATLLGFKGRGTAPVRVTYLRPAPLHGDDSAMIAADGTQLAGLENRRQLNTASIETNTYGGALRRDVSIRPAGLIYVQAATFANYDNAVAARQTLSGAGEVRIEPVEVQGSRLYRVRIGPFSDHVSARQAVEAAQRSGYGDARLAEAVRG